MRKSTKKNPSYKKSTPQSFSFLCEAQLIFIKKRGIRKQSFLPESYFHFLIVFKSTGVASIRLIANPPLRANFTDILFLFVTNPFFI